MSFKEMNPQQNFPKLEQEILKFWQINKIFEKSLDKNPKNNKFIFYEGPPTANGKPGIHHVLARAFKDIICRYKTMKGFYVKRRAGWDTHGLPVEIEVEKSLGISGKKQIEDYGVEKFNQKCRDSVWAYKKDWEELTERIGFWIDLKNPYITYENSYIKKVWGILKQIWEKDLIYSGFKVVPYCPRCETTLSSHEVAQGYKNIEEESVYVKFKVKSEKFKDNYFLVWTTTPWTLPGNIALAVGKDIQYVKIRKEEEYLILAKDRLDVIGGDYEIVEELSAQDIEGHEYEPLYDSNEFIKEKPFDAARGRSDKNFKVYSVDFVSTKEGTGIVHMAPAFGEDDMNLQNKIGFSIPLTVSSDGKMLAGMGKGKFVKDADTDIKNDLDKRGLLYKTENIKHDYPFCWRCDSILIYYAKTTWFIAMSKLREKLIQNNEDINWIPAYIKEGRFGEWLKDVKDWALSRERYWGTPLPIWQCECGQKEMIGSISELKEKATSDIKDDFDLHKPYIDEIKIKCPKCGKETKRVPEVIDAWFDSGSMPFASGEENEGFYPAEFISEAIDQTRGWFYTMLAISTLLDKGTSYKNVICLAHILDEKGKKMSKSKGNMIDTAEIANKFGVDSLRWYFYTVNGPGDPKRLGERNIEVTLRQFIMILWNVYSFFVTYANVDGWTTEKIRESDNVLDKWILSELNITIQIVEDNLDHFNIVQAARQIQRFNEELSTWYLRRSRKRRDDEFYSTIYDILKKLSVILAPFIPFTAEAIYQNLKTDKDPESVHLEEWPKAGEIDEKLIDDMRNIRLLAELAHAQRAENKLKVRQPLAKATIKKDFDKDLLTILKDEINVKEIVLDKNIDRDIIIDTKLTSALLEEGKLREIIRQIQEARKKAGLNPGEQAELEASGSAENKNFFTKFENEIIKTTNISKVHYQISTDSDLVLGVKK